MATRKGANPEFLFLEPANFEFKPAMRLWTKDEMRAKYTVQLTVGEHKFIGEADLPQTAKHNAALLAIPVLNVMPDVKLISGPSTPGGDTGTLPNGKQYWLLQPFMAQFLEQSCFRSTFAFMRFHY